MYARTPELSTAPFLQDISDLTTVLKKQRKTVRGTGCLKRQQSAEQLQELDRQLLVLKKLQQNRDNFLEFYKVAVLSVPMKQGKDLPDTAFNFLMRSIIAHGGERYAIKLQLTQLAAIHN